MPAPQDAGRVAGARLTSTWGTIGASYCSLAFGSERAAE